jgi:Ran GTPase-activating protein (RanGAP) involved in mRNA processing and transport
VNSLHELCVSHTRFKDNTFSIFLNVLTSCSSLRKLCFTDNGLTKQEINFLIPAFESMKDLVNLNLSKSNLTETQANDILRKDGEGKCIVSLDLSQNALQGNKIIIGICHLQSLEELNLSHNHIRFFPLPNLDKQRDQLPINTTTISLSSNHMTPEDVGSFCFLIKSNLMKLNLDFNHVGNFIWSLCTQGLKHLNVLSLANTDICGPAVKGLAFLLSFVGELEELNLSSNNLVLGDFQQLQSPLSNLTQLKRLNLSNNPDGISVILHEILPSLKYLEELRLSNVHLNGDGLNKICHLLASLKGLKHLDLSMNAIGSDGTRALANILKEFPLLEELNMSKSCIKEDEISVLCKGLVSLNRLKYLNLSGNRIDIEVIPDPVFLPPMLEELIFSKVIHGGKLFSNISLLQHLRKLHLSEINLRPCDVEALTAMLSSFPLLEELVLAKTVCTDCEKIFSAIKSLENIKKIDLTGIKIPDGNAIAEMLPSLLSLQELVLTNMNVTNKRDGIIFSKIKLLKNLRKLDFDGIKIWDEIAFFDMLSSLSFLEDIVLPRINLKDADDVTGFFRALKSLRYLKNFYVHNVNSKTSVVDDFAKVLPSLLQLEKLVLEGIKFGNQENVKQLFTPVEKLTYLKELELKCFTITQAGADSLAEVLPSLQLLEKLVLENVNYDDDIDDESGKQLFTAVGKLTYLKELELRCVKITQACSDSLAEVLPSLQLLEKLVLKNVRRTDDESIKQVFAAVGKLTYLKELELNWCKITQAGADSLAEVLPSLQLLEKLVLKNVNYVDDNEGEKQLFAAVGKLTYLKELELGCFTITQAGEDSLAEVLPSLQLMEKLVLEYEIYDDDDDDESGKQLFTAVGKLMYLKELEFKCYVITQACSDSLAEVLPSLQLLEKLVLKDVIYSADIDDGSKKQLFAAVGKLTYLKELEFEWWTISQAGANSLAEVLPSLQSLEKLVLKDVNYDVDIDDESEKQLFTAVGKLMYLKELQLKWNNITQAGVDSLAEVLPSLQLLEKLVLEDVNHDDDDDDDDDDDESGKQLFAAVGKLMYLKELQLKWNKITQASVDSLAEVLSSLQLLEKLELRTFNFTNINDQQLYTAIGSLSCLKELNLSFTKITDAGAENLIDVLPSLRHLTCITLPSVYGTLGSRLEAAASQVPGLKVK